MSGGRWRVETAQAAMALESRWTMLALRRVDADVARRLHEQRNLFDAACFSGTEAEIADHGAALCRGYAMAVRLLEQAGEPDDAYLIGQCPVSGTKVAIGHQRAAAQRVRDLHGDRVVWLTPDECARMLSAYQTLARVKQLWPGAETIERYPDEPDQAA